jgi:hypothetical protein
MEDMNGASQNGAASHFVRTDPIPESVDTQREKRSLWSRLRHAMSDRRPSRYSSLSPRRPDGTRGPIFPFNSSGGGGGGGL